MNKKCKNCGELIPKDLDFCNEECMKAYIAKNKENLLFLTQFDKGFGSDRRDRNISKIINLLKQGVDENHIKIMLRRYFKPVTIDDYLETAKLTIELEEKGRIQPNA